MLPVVSVRNAVVTALPLASAFPSLLCSGNTGLCASPSAPAPCICLARRTMRPASPSMPGSCCCRASPFSSKATTCQLSSSRSSRLTRSCGGGSRQGKQQQWHLLLQQAQVRVQGQAQEPFQKRGHQQQQPLRVELLEGREVPLRRALAASRALLARKGVLEVVYLEVRIGHSRAGTNNVTTIGTGGSAQDARLSCLLF